MAGLSRAIRSKRFKVAPKANVTVIIQAPTGTQFTLKVENCSIVGIGAYSDVPLPEDEGLIAGSMLPPAKLVFDGEEAFLGRLVLRGSQARDGKFFYGLQAIDAKLPIDGPLSRSLELSDDEKSSAYDYELDPDKFNLATFLASEQQNVDLFGRCKEFSILFKEWKQSPKYQYKSIRTSSKGPRINLTVTRRGGRNDYLMMGSNDYLGLAHHPKVMEAAKSAIDQYGFGSTGSPVTTGYTKIHEELCEFVARYFRKQRAILFNSGYAANLGIVNGLTGELDLVIADIISHASIQDGMQMSKATSRFFKHNDMAHMDKVLTAERGEYAGCMAITEGVFSMDGDVAPIDKFVQCAKKHNARTMVDEAHSFGVVGPNGEGACAKYGITDQVDMIMGTFSKIGGGIGGFVAADENVVEWLYHFARSHLFTVSIPPSTAAAALQALRIFAEDTSLVENLRRNIRHFTQGLQALGYPISPNHESAVVPVVIGDERKLGLMNEALRSEGVFVTPVVYPAVKRDGSRFRFTMMATHTISDLDFVLNVLEKAMLKAGVTFESQQKLQIVA